MLMLTSLYKKILFCNINSVMLRNTAKKRNVYCNSCQKKQDNCGASFATYFFSKGERVFEFISFVTGSIKNVFTSNCKSDRKQN